MNGGTCIDGVDNFTCSCPPRLTGTLCDCLILDDGSYDCEYVSPTFAPSPNESAISTLFTESTTTGSTLTIDYTKYNMSLSTSISTVSESMNLSTAIHTDSTTEMITTALPTDSTVLTTEAITTTNASKTEIDIDLTTQTRDSKEIESTTLKIDVTTDVVTEEITRPTLEVDSSKTEATTECTDSCIKVNVSTMDLPPSVTVLTKPSTEKITTSKDITEGTSPMLPEGTSSTKATVSDDTTKTDTVTKTSTDTTTLSKDATTEKMFTDTPIDTTHSDFVTSKVTATESTVSDIDATTQALPTSQSECTDSFCNNHGTCINGLHGIRVRFVFIQFTALRY